MPDPRDRLASALADRYTLERELGAGGMATVFLAHDVRHNRKVAIKVLRAELLGDLGAERFLKEIETTANLQHPNILPLFDSGRVDGTVFYVMPYVAGESLRHRLARETELPVGDAIRIAAEIAEGLEYAHRHGVIHRDIKPDNVLFPHGRALRAGEPPFTGPGAQGILARVMTEEPRRLGQRRRTVPAHVDAAVARALEKLPADRFQTAAELRDALTGK